jgi:hypothetical protein
MQKQQRNLIHKHVSYGSQRCKREINIKMYLCECAKLSELRPVVSFVLAVTNFEAVMKTCYLVYTVT